MWFVDSIGDALNFERLASGFDQLGIKYIARNFSLAI